MELFACLKRSFSGKYPSKRQAGWVLDKSLPILSKCKLKSFPYLRINFVYFYRYNSRHVALKILYLGWDYHGLATQEDTNNTIEAALFDVLIKTRLIESR